MNDILRKRILDEANYIINTKDTIRNTAIKYNVSKSTIYNDLTKKIISIDNKYTNILKSIFKNNFNNKHLKGGLATKNKYRGII